MEKSNILKMRSLKFNFVMNIILRLSSIVFPLITLPYITRTIGPIGNGKVAFAVSVINYFSMFAQLGIPTYGIRACARCRDDKNELTKTVQEIVAINAVSVTVSYVTLIVSILLIPKFRQDPILLIINSATILLNAAGLEWLYQAVEQYQYITIRNIAFKIVSIIFMFLLVKMPDDYIIYGGLTVLSASGSCILNLLNARKILYIRRYKNYSIKRHLKPIFLFFALSAAVSIYTNMDVVMLGFMSSEAEVGYYSMATKIKLVLALMISALGPVLLPRISYYLSHGCHKEFAEVIKKSLNFVLIISLPVTAYFFCMAPQVVMLLGSEEYKPAIACMQIIIFTVIPLGFGNIASMQILAPAGLERCTVKSAICGAIVNLVINSLLIPKIGASGAAIGTVVTETIVMLLQLYYARSVLQNVMKGSSLLKVGVATTISIALLCGINHYLSLSPFVQLFITAVVFFGGYVLCLLIEKEKTVWYYFNALLKKANQSL